MNDSAKGPLAGYLYQFEKALYLLSNLGNAADFITIEEIDDIATHSENGTVIFTVQAKHSISASGTTFEDTSYALWRTLQIWIEKLESNFFDSSTTFICSTNKTIPLDSLLYNIKNGKFDDVILRIEELLKQQKESLAKKTVKKPTGGATIKTTIDFIEFVLSKKDVFKTIATNIQIDDNENLKENFFTKIHLNSDKYTDTIKEHIFNTFYGWIVYSSKAKWNQSDTAKFTKKQFDEQLFNINSNASIINNVFRTKESIGTISERKIDEQRKELFVKQIEDLPRRKDAQERIIRKAIHDFIYSDIEIAYIVKKGDFTKEDFEGFLNCCENTWQTLFDNIFIKEFDQYTKEEKDELAISLYNKIMEQAEIKFKEGFTFTTNNEYLRNGSFLKLSNVPKIGWHPEWTDKYKQ